MKKEDKIYLVWQEEQFDDDGDLVDGGFYSQYTSLEDAVSSETADEVEVYEAKPVLLGTFKQKVSCVKVKRKKK